MSAERYSRQVLLAEIGAAGQASIRAGRAVLIGCGALGSSIANTLVRAGVGRLRFIDADHVELSNLQRQTLYTEADAAAGRLKVEALAAQLARINSEVELEPVAERIDGANIDRLLGRPEVVLDGSDNFDLRYLLNDHCVRTGLSWVYGGVAATYGLAMPVVPGRTPCLRCIFPEPPPPKQAPTADDIGILAPIAHLVAAVQCAEALKLLSGRVAAIQPRLHTADLWAGRLDSLKLGGPEPTCACCGQRPAAPGTGGA